MKTILNYAGLRSTYLPDKVFVQGCNTIGDGGEGIFFWDSASTEADNGGTVFNVTGVAIGRWVRIYEGGLNVQWFGAVGDGTADDTAAIALAVAAACRPTSVTTEVIIPRGGNGVYNISATIDVTAAITITWHSSALSKIASCDLLLVKVPRVNLINVGIKGNGATWAGGGIRFLVETFDCSISNCHINGTRDSGIIFNGPSGGSGIVITGGSIITYNAVAAAIRLDGLEADIADPSPRCITDVSSSIVDLIDFTGMSTTFVKGGQCEGMRFYGNPNVHPPVQDPPLPPSVSHKSIITGVRIRQGLSIKGSDHLIDACSMGGVAPNQSVTTYGVVLVAQVGSGLIKLGSSNSIVNGIFDENAGVGGLAADFCQYNVPFTSIWFASGTPVTSGLTSYLTFYSINGRMVQVNIYGVFDGTALTAGNYAFTLPPNLMMDISVRGMGAGFIYNAGGGIVPLTVVPSGFSNPSRVELYTPAGLQFSSTVPFASYASGDSFEFQFNYIRN